MSYDEPLVGSLSVFLGITAAAIAIGPWSMPYELKSISAIRHRYGKLAARGAWIALAVAFLSMGIAVLAGIRPSYAEPARQVDASP